MSRYAENTSVGTDKSRAEIERTLQRYGADGFMYGWQGARALVQFVAHGRQIVEPGKSVTLSIEGRAGGGDLPQPGLGAVHEEAREENVARDQLAALGETAHRAGFRLRDEPLCRGLVPAQPRMQLVHEPGAAPGNPFRGKHRL